MTVLLAVLLISVGIALAVADAAAERDDDTVELPAVPTVPVQPAAEATGRHAIRPGALQAIPTTPARHYQPQHQAAT